MSNPREGAVAEWGFSRRSRCSKALVLLSNVLASVWTGLIAIAPVLAAEVISFPAGAGGWHLGTIGVGNLDTDAQLEIVVPYRDGSARWFLDAFKANGTRILGFPYGGGGEEINVSPTLYDLNGDGRAEILFTQGNRILALRGNGTVLWSNVVTRLNYLPNGGYMTVTNGFYWSDGGGLLALLPASAVFSSQVSSPIVADLNGDGLKEVVTAWKIDPDNAGNHQDFNPFINDIWGFAEWGTAGESWSGGVLFHNASTGARTHNYHLHQLVESGLALGQADEDGPLETYVLNDSDSVVCFDKSRPHGLYGNGTLHGQFGKNQRFTSGSYQLGIDLYTTDLDGDGKAEVLVPTTHRETPWQPSETILDDKGSILWRQWNQPVSFPLNQWQNNAAMIPVNPDRDNRIDVLAFVHSHQISFRSWNGVELVDRPGWPKDFAPFLPTPPVVGDVDGDGQEEIVIGTYHPGQSPSTGTLYVFALDGALKSSVPVAGGLKHIPTLADVTGDGGIEVIYRSLGGRIHVQNFGATRLGPVSWSTHRGNMRRDGNLGVSLFPAGTPLIPRRETGFRRASFSWSVSATNAAKGWRIYRAEKPEGPFALLASLGAGQASFSDELLSPGSLYVYEVAAVYDDRVVCSAPFALAPSFNRNLIANGGFEQNDNAHWDKWFTGEIAWTNMVSTTNAARQGRKAMEITLVNKGNSGSIAQFNQYGTPDAFLSVTGGQLYSFGGFFKSGGITEPSEHWLEWGSAKTGEDTNNRPARAFPDYFTPYFAAGAQSSEWTYANRTFVMPPGFPNVELGHRYTIAAPGSGSIRLDDVFFRSLPSLVATNWTDLLPFGSLWRYATGVLPTHWSAPSFNDTLWLAGLAKFGAGSGPTNILTPLISRQPAYFFRRSFNVPARPIEDLLLSATCTDAGKYPEIYLNGARVVTSGIDVVTDQGNAVRHFDLTPFVYLLRPGTNIIAVLINNGWQPDWDDVAFDLRLKAILGATATPRFEAIERPSGIPTLSGIDLNISAPPNTVWRLESSDSLSPPWWQLVTRFTNSLPVPFWLRDTGQNGRLPPRQAPKRFYRMVEN